MRVGFDLRTSLSEVTPGESIEWPQRTSVERVGINFRALSNASYESIVLLPRSMVLTVEFDLRSASIKDDSDGVPFMWLSIMSVLIVDFELTASLNSDDLKD